MDSLHGCLGKRPRGEWSHFVDTEFRSDGTCTVVCPYPFPLYPPALSAPLRSNAGIAPGRGPSMLHAVRDTTKSTMGTEAVVVVVLRQAVTACPRTST